MDCTIYISVEKEEIKKMGSRWNFVPDNYIRKPGKKDETKDYDWSRKGKTNEGTVNDWRNEIGREIVRRETIRIGRSGVRGGIGNRGRGERGEIGRRNGSMNSYNSHFDFDNDW